MFSFIPDELAWAIRREREEEARSVLPHTSIKPDPERTFREVRQSEPGVWVAPSLRLGRGLG